MGGKLYDNNYDKLITTYKKSFLEGKRNRIFCVFIYTGKSPDNYVIPI